VIAHTARAMHTHATLKFDARFVIETIIGNCARDASQQQLHHVARTVASNWLLARLNASRLVLTYSATTRTHMSTIPLRTHRERSLPRRSGDVSLHAHCNASNRS
jgi:hypothetical protein